ncbi:RbmA family biofilm matrix protein [Vibrio neptunius]|uniref:RbmA family biofilm matrix protein n=1 Tax=Vibrio neptunius TaxID=170651 RepID=UPI001C5CA6DD|nr:RbmA protein [Vibrio neptunius]QXX09140.1 RbmA protein [Vibrio neptunius]
MKKLCIALLSGSLAFSTPLSVFAVESKVANEEFLLDAQIQLSKNEIPTEGGYLSANINLTNIGDEEADLKYWVSVTGPKGIVFPAKAVVGVNSSEFDSENIEEGSALHIERGIWVREYMDDGLYKVAVEGVNVKTGKTFSKSESFAKGVSIEQPATIDGLILESYVVNDTTYPSEGGYLILDLQAHNTRTEAANIEFWVTAIGPDGLAIPVHARVLETVPALEELSIIRGFTLDASYPDGEYTIVPQLYDVDSGQRVEGALKVYKGNAVVK